MNGYLSSIEPLHEIFKKGEALKLTDKNGYCMTTVITGDNNSGKSRLLRDNKTHYDASFNDIDALLIYLATSTSKKSIFKVLESIICKDDFIGISKIEVIDDCELWFIMNNKKVPITEVGSACLRILSILVSIAQKYKKGNNVCVVDDIEKHLSPQMQRKIMPVLIENFPLTQFIVSTNSPFIIQSIPNINLFQLIVKDGLTEIFHHDTTTYIGWTIDEILEHCMGMMFLTTTNQVQDMYKEFDSGMNNEDYKQTKAAYEELEKVLNPNNTSTKLLRLQMSSLVPE